MASDPNKLSKFWQEIKRRRVIHLITVYASASFVIIELANNVAEPLNLPENLPAIIITALAIGFPIAIILSWIFDITPKGIEKTNSIDAREEVRVETPNSWRIATYVSVVIIVGLVLFNIFMHKNTAQNLLDDINSIAVLPFVDMSPQKNQEYFCDGISEEIINSLAQLDGLKVIARTSTFAFKGKNEDVREIGKKLNVKTILEGSIRKEDTRLRITAQLIRVSDGSHIWAENYDRELVSVFDLQDEIALAVSENLKVNLLGENKEIILSRYTDNLEAYNLYLQGIYNRELMTPEGIQNSIRYFEQALEIDPEFALAYVNLAYVYYYLSFGLLSPELAAPKVAEYVHAAMEIDDGIPHAYSLLGDINMNFYWNWEESEKNYKKALELNPNSAGSYSSYSILLTYLGRNKEALVMTKKAQELDPMSGWVIFSVGWAYYHNQRYDKAIEVLETAIALDPNSLMAQYYLGLAYRATSNLQKAVAIHEELYEHTADVRTMAVLIISYYEAGEKEKANALYQGLAPRIENEYISPALLYLIYKARGEADLAYHWFEEAVNINEGWIVWMIVNPFERDRIPNEPRYDALLRKVGLEKYHQNDQ